MTRRYWPPIIYTVDPRVEEYVDELMLKEYPTFWENLPASARKMVYDRVRKSTPQLVDNLVEDVSDNIEDLLDIKGMVIERLASDKQLLNRIFLECGDVENSALSSTPACTSAFCSA